MSRLYEATQRALRPAGGVATAMPPSAPRVTTAATPATMAPLTRVSPRVLRGHACFRLSTDISSSLSERR